VTTKILTIGHKHPKWVIAACEDFLVRLPKSYQPKIEALPLATRPHVSYDAKQALVFKNNEGDSILKKIQPEDWVIALHPTGQFYTTPELATLFDTWNQHHKNIVFLIGGPDGLSDAVLARANCLLSLSALTYPHTLAKVILVEQLYRAYTLRQNHPYHR
jgi:23S rRNA (pseudouridine1915-N3)-methyltransferase